MKKNILGSFISWLIVNKRVKNKIEFATLAGINRGHLYKMTKGEGDISDFMLGNVLDAFGKEYKEFMDEQITVETDYSIALEPQTEYNKCKKCVVKSQKIEQLTVRISELEELVQLYRAASPLKKEGKRAV